MTTLVVLWMRFGPYHLARLQAAADAVGERGWSLCGVEVASQDHYAWESVASAGGFTRQTLFPRGEYAALRRGDIRRAVGAALDRLQPMAVAVNGWSAPEAQAALAWVRRTRSARAVIMSETKFNDVPRRFWKEWAKRRIVSQAQAGLVGGELQRDYLSQLRLPRERIMLGYNAVDNAYFAVGADAARTRATELRATLGLPDRYFFACTRFLPRKNLDGLLSAYAGYRERMGGVASWGLVISGSGECEHALRAQVVALGLGDSVRFVGFLQYGDLPLYYGLASAFVHPAHSEPWGLVVNEAAASGLPLLVSETVGAGYELVQTGLNGERFAPADTEALADALYRMSARPDAALQAMGQAAWARVAQYGPERFATGLLAAVDAAWTDQR